MGKKLYKNKDRKMISGVLAGFSEYLDIDVTILRVGYVVVAIFTEGFPLLVLYIILAILLPEKDVAFRDNNSYTSWNKDDTYHDNQGPSWKKDEPSWKKDEPSWTKNESAYGPGESTKNPYDPAGPQNETPRDRYKKAGGSYVPKSGNDEYGPEGYREIKEDDKN
ncbi:MAG TPA: PspC domain-containing protein [Clostridiaceae bacterium]|nr:PspC domain-containing protein [Clostridiaceae bacterium]